MMVEGKSTELDLSSSKFTHIPGGVVETWKTLTTLKLNSCSSLAALPESIGQLRALTALYLDDCTSLADESRQRGDRLVQRNTQIRDGRPQRFLMATHAFAASVLFGSMKPSNIGMTNAAPSAIWRLIADYSGVSYKAAFEKWVTEIELKIKEDLGLSDVFGLVELE